jgi:putative PIN family toxin of toxin-antitoxin system
VIKVVLDTSVLVSGLLSSNGSPAEVLERWREGLFDVVVCPQLLQELRATLAKPSLKERVTTEQAATFALAVSRAAINNPDPAPIPPATRDPGDDFLVALAAEARAQAIVSVDHDLLDATAMPVLALTPRVFLDRLGDG